MNAEVLAAVRSFLDRDPIPMFVDGSEFDSTTNSLSVVDPSYGTALAQVGAATASDVDVAVTSARRALSASEWRTLAPAEVGELLWRLADLVERDGRELAQLDSLCC